MTDFRAGLIAGLVAAGLGSCAAPPLPPVALRVEASYPGANARVVADAVAAPIEQQVNGVEGALYLLSRSKNDGSYALTVAFPPGTDLDAARVLVQKRVAIAAPSLPEEVRRAEVKVRVARPGESAPSLRPGLTAVLVNVGGDEHPRHFALAVEGELKRDPAVASARAEAATDEATETPTIEIDRAACARLKVRPEDVTAAVRLVPAGGRKEFGKLRVRAADGEMVRLIEVASLRSTAGPGELWRYNLSPAAGVTVEPAAGRTERDVRAAVERALNDVRRAPRPRLVWPGDR